jgi:acyl carrier protein
MESMQQQDIYTQLTTIFHDLFDDDTIVLNPGLTAADVPEWDSFNHINLIVAIEARFGVKFQTAELESMQTVGHLADLIQSKLAAQGR